MDQYFLKAILLENCPYSIATHELITKNQLPVSITWVSETEKDKYKTTDINTFPQIYLKKYNNNGNLLLGGHQEFANFISTFFKQKLLDTNINAFMDKTKWTRKSTLRLVQLINKIETL